MAKVPEYIKENIYQVVKRDLEPNRLTVHAKIGFSVVAGGASSLFFCGQMGLGLSSLAHSVHEVLMDYGGYLGCTIWCGVLFALLPVVVLRLLTSHIQYHILLRKERSVIACWILACGFFLVLQSQASNALLAMVLWGLPAVLSFYLLGWSFCQLSRMHSLLQSSVARALDD